MPHRFPQTRLRTQFCLSFIFHCFQFSARPRRHILSLRLIQLFNCLPPRPIEFSLMSVFTLHKINDSVNGPINIHNAHPSTSVPNTDNVCRCLAFSNKPFVVQHTRCPAHCSPIFCYLPKHSVMEFPFMFESHFGLRFE